MTDHQAGAYPMAIPDATEAPDTGRIVIWVKGATNLDEVILDIDVETARVIWADLGHALAQFDKADG